MKMIKIKNKKKLAKPDNVVYAYSSMCGQKEISSQDSLKAKREECHQAHSQDFKKGSYMGVWCVCTCMHKHRKLYKRVWGHRPQEIFEIRCSEMASEAILRCRYQGGFGGFSSP